MKRIAFLASYNGSSAKAITIACRNGTLNAVPALMISNNANSNALAWAKEEGLEVLHIKGDDKDVRDALIAHAIDVAVLSGYMKLIGTETVRAFPKKIINIHPGLLPGYGGKGMYGRHVHEAVKAANEKETGITIHYVDEIYDHGDVIAQKIIPLSPNDSVDDIEAKVRAEEPGFYVETLKFLL